MNDQLDIMQSAATDKLWPALLKFHKNPPAIVKEGIIAMHGKERKYITLDSILHAVRPALAELGLFIQQHLAGDSVVTIITHESGQFFGSRLPFQTMNGAGTNNLQNLGGGLTYLRRYALTAILAIAADADDDGNGGGIETKPAKQEDSRPWLNKGTKKWDDMLLAIEMGQVNSVDQIESKYRLNKADRAEVVKLLTPVGA